MHRWQTGSMPQCGRGPGASAFSLTEVGSIERLMIDKMSGKVTYVVMSFDGFLGFGEDYYPLP